MTDANEERPLTRRELRARERAAELAATGGVPPVPDEETLRLAESAPEHTGKHSTPSVPGAPDDAQALADAVSEPAEAELVATDAAQSQGAEPVDAAPAKPRGRFFGRKKDKKAAAEAAPVEEAPADAAPSNTVVAEPEPTVAIEQVGPGSAQNDPDGVDVLEAELAEPATEADTAAAAPSAPAPAGASVPAPSSARRSNVPVDDVQGLDTVDDAAVDDLEIDEVVVEQPRVSSRRVADVTPAELEDRRQVDGEADDESPTTAGPTRGQSQRLPVIVNVVSDTSEHHIADLREQGVAGSGGTSTSSITANALVLPAGSESPDFTLEGDDGLLVTGSIDVPEGFASSGRGRAAIDGNDVDSEVAEGEVTSPETAPVRASKAVSSYANARVQIAPQKQRTNAWPVVIGVGAGAFVVGVGTVLFLAISQGWL